MYWIDSFYIFVLEYEFFTIIIRKYIICFKFIHNQSLKTKDQGVNTLRNSSFLLTFRSSSSTINSSLYSSIHFLICPLCWRTIWLLNNRSKNSKERTLVCNCSIRTSWTHWLSICHSPALLNIFSVLRTFGSWKKTSKGFSNNIIAISNQI